MIKYNISIGSYIRAINGEHIGNVYKVFDKSHEGNYIAAGVKRGNILLSIDNIVLATEEEFNEAHQDECLQDSFFF